MGPAIQEIQAYIAALQHASSWGDDEGGDYLQFGPGAGPTATNVVMGVDFGTSSTKLVMRVPFVDTVARVVPLVSKEAGSYFLRTTNPQAAKGLLRNVKVRLVANPQDRDAAVAATMLLAHIMRHARKWFLATQKSAYGKFKLRWEVNVGVPAAGYSDEPIEQIIRRCASAAWELSLKRTVNPEDAVQALDAGADHAPVASIPEIIASAEAYRRSVSAKSGVHVLLDLGATTLDACAFKINFDGNGSPYKIFAATVSESGVAVLHHERVQALRAAGVALAPRVVNCDPHAPDGVIPQTIHEYLASGESLPVKAKKVEEAFENRCEIEVTRVLATLWMKTGHEVEKPMAVVGGGAALRLYSGLGERIRRKWKNWAWSDVVSLPLTVPKELVGGSNDKLDDAVKRRLLVAYGLSFPRPDFGEFPNPELIPNIPPKPVVNKAEWSGLFLENS